MARQLPKNVRQIGNVSDSSKIYIEDYVDTFFNQLCEKANEEMLGAFLIGEIVQEEENDYIYVNGAINMQNLSMKGKDFVLEENVWKNACETCKEYFGDAEILGWFITGGGQPIEVNHNIHKIHQKYFPREKSIFVTKNTRDREEKYYVYKYRDMMECKGHFVFYERNVEMQNYMIACRKKNGMTPSEVIEDRAAKNFRSIIQEKLDKTEQKKHSRLVYAMSTFLVLVVLVIGVTMLNNYDKMQDMQNDETVETVGQVTTKEPENETLPGIEVDEPEDESVQSEEETHTGEEQTEQIQTEQIQTEDVTENPQNVEQSGNAETDTSEEETEEVYVVEKGDTLAAISRKVYGDTSYVDDICKLNGLEDGNLIMIGQKILLP